MSISIEEIEKSREVRKAIKKYTEVENDEFQEACDVVGNLLSYSDYISEELWRGLLVEHCKQLIHYKENTEWVETEEVITRKFTELEWKI